MKIMAQGSEGKDASSDIEIVIIQPSDNKPKLGNGKQASTVKRGGKLEGSSSEDDDRKLFLYTFVALGLGIFVSLFFVCLIVFQNDYAVEATSAPDLLPSQILSRFINETTGLANSMDNVRLSYLRKMYASAAVTIMTTHLILNDSLTFTLNFKIFIRINYSCSL
jgi:hypothetical protein